MKGKVSKAVKQFLIFTLIFTLLGENILVQASMPSETAVSAGADETPGNENSKKEETSETGSADKQQDHKQATGSEKTEGTVPGEENKTEGTVPGEENKTEGTVPGEENKTEGTAPGEENKTEGAVPQDENKVEDRAAEEIKPEKAATPDNIDAAYIPSEDKNPDPEAYEGMIHAQPQNSNTGAAKNVSIINMDTDNRDHKYTMQVERRDLTEHIEKGSTEQAEQELDKYSAEKVLEKLQDEEETNSPFSFKKLFYARKREKGVFRLMNGDGRIQPGDLTEITHICRDESKGVNEAIYVKLSGSDKWVQVRYNSGGDAVEDNTNESSITGTGASGNGYAVYLGAEIDYSKEALDTSDTEDFISVNIFDYSPENINTDLGVVQETGENSGKVPGHTYGYAADKWIGLKNNTSKQFRFFASQIYGGCEGNTPWAYDSGKVGGGMEETQGLVAPLLENGIPELLVGEENGAKDQKFPLSRLFSTDKTVNSDYIGTANHLFQHDKGTGKFTYDSGENAAFYDEGEGRFYVYPYKTADKRSDFLPFNYVSRSGMNENIIGSDDDKDIRKDVVNYWFGMSMAVDFLQADDGQVKNEDMVFEFTGDDDVWLYLDNKLVLDMGGTHGAGSGTINFRTGEVKVKNHNSKEVETTTLRDKFKAAGVTEEELAKIFYKDKDGHYRFFNGTTHTMNFFYLERGGTLSDCKLEFNLLKPESLVVGKEVKWDEADPGLDKDPAVLEAEKGRKYRFRLTKHRGGDKPAEPLADSPYRLAQMKDGRLVYSEDQTEYFTDSDGILELEAGQYAVFSVLGLTQYRVAEVTPANLSRLLEEKREPEIDGQYYGYYSQHYSGVKVEMGSLIAKEIDASTGTLDRSPGAPVSGGEKLASSKTTISIRGVKGHREEGWKESLDTNVDIVTTANPDEYGVPGMGYRSTGAALGNPGWNTELDKEADYYVTIPSSMGMTREQKEKLSYNNVVVFTNLLNPAYYQRILIGKEVTGGDSEDFLPRGQKVKDKMGQEFQFQITASQIKDGKTEYTRANGIAYGLYRLNEQGRLTQAYDGAASLHADSEGRFKLKGGEYAVLELLSGTQIRVEEQDLNSWDYDKVTVQTGSSNVTEALDQGKVLELEKSAEKQKEITIRQEEKYGYTNNWRTCVTTKKEGIAEDYFVEEGTPEFTFQNVGRTNNQFIFTNRYNPVLLKLLIGKEVVMERSAGATAAALISQQNQILLQRREGAVARVPSRPNWINVSSRLRDEDFTFKLYYKDDSDSASKEKPAGDVKFAVYRNVESDGTANGKYYKWTEDNGKFTLNPGEYAVFYMPYEAKFRVTEKELQGLSYKQEEVQIGHAIINTAEEHIETDTEEKYQKLFELPKVNSVYNITTAGEEKVAAGYHNGETAPKKSLVLFESQNQAVFTSVYNGRPKTGDDTPIALLAGVAGISVAAVAGLLFWRKKSEKSDKNKE